MLNEDNSCKSDIYTHSFYLTHFSIKLEIWSDHDIPQLCVTAVESKVGGRKLEVGGDSFVRKTQRARPAWQAFCTEARFIYIYLPRVLCNPPFYFLPSALNSYPSHDIRFCNHQNQIALSRFLLLMAIFVLTVLWDVWLSAIHSFEKGLGNFSNKQTTRTMRNERFKEPPQRVTLKITSKFIPRVHSDRAPKKSYVYKNKFRRWVETFVGVCVRLFFNHLHNIIWWRGSCDLW